MSRKNATLWDKNNDDANDDHIGDRDRQQYYDEGFWECSLCTYKNSADLFKCDVCEAAKRVSSTRKPRASSDVMLAQVLKQQEQIQKQVKAVKVPKSRASIGVTAPSSPPINQANNNNPNNSIFMQYNPTSTSKLQSRQDNSNSKPIPSKVTKNNLHRERSSSSSSNSSSISSNTSQHGNSEPEPSAQQQQQQQASTTNKTNIIVTVPLLDGSNKFKYPTPKDLQTGKTGIIIDKRRFTEYAVTINEVTVTFTEFATRKKKETEPKKKKKKSARKLVGAAAAAAAKAAARNAAAAAAAAAAEAATASDETVISANEG